MGWRRILAAQWVSIALRGVAASPYNPARVGGGRVPERPRRGPDACGRPNDPLPGLSSRFGLPRFRSFRKAPDG
jgi:hypothetical protein